MDEALSEPVYGYQLRVAKNEKDVEFLIESVLEEKVIDGVPSSYVKFLFYPDKFNLWIPSVNIRSGKPLKRQLKLQKVNDEIAKVKK